MGPPRVIKNETYTTRQPDGSVVTTTTRVHSKYVEAEEDYEALGCGPGTLNERYCCTPIGILRIVEIVGEH